MNKNICIRKILSGVFLIIAVIIFKPSVSKGLDVKQKFVEYASTGNYFKCKIPADWRAYNQDFGLSEEEKKIYGITLFGPKNGSPVSPLISIHYYDPENNLHHTMDMFIRLHSKPILGLDEEGNSYTKVEQIEIAGREAQAFSCIDIQFVGEQAVKVALFELFFVIPVKKGEGFYVIKLSVPDETKGKYKGIFQETLNSFLPGK